MLVSADFAVDDRYLVAGVFNVGGAHSHTDRRPRRQFETADLDFLGGYAGKDRCRRAKSQHLVDERGDLVGVLAKQCPQLRALLDGDFDRATRYDAERAWRWVIALLHDDQPAAEHIQQEIGDCPHCLRTLAGYLAGTCSGMLLARGGKGAALKAAQHMLDEVLSSPDIINTDPTE